MVGTDLLLAGPRLIGRLVCDRFSFERLTGIDLEALDEGLTHIGEWFEEAYRDD